MTSEPQNEPAAKSPRLRPAGDRRHLAPPVGFGDDRVARRFHHDGLVRRRVALRGGRSPSALFSQTKLISDEQMEVRIALGTLIALLVISAIVVWIYTARLRAGRGIRPPSARLPAG